jgi:hypothetical protein
MLNAASANTNVRIFFANLQGICTFFSNSPQRTAVLDETVKKRLPRSASTRWNFNSRVVCTVFEHREDLIQVSQKWRTNYLLPYRECLNVHEKNMEKMFPTKKSIIFIIIINGNTM